MSQVFQGFCPRTLHVTWTMSDYQKDPSSLDFGLTIFSVIEMTDRMCSKLDDSGLDQTLLRGEIKL